MFLVPAVLDRSIHDLLFGTIFCTIPVRFFICFPAFFIILFPTIHQVDIPQGDDVARLGVASPCRLELHATIKSFFALPSLDPPQIRNVTLDSLITFPADSPQTYNGLIDMVKDRPETVFHL